MLTRDNFDAGVIAHRTISLRSRITDGVASADLLHDAWLPTIEY